MQRVIMIFINGIGGVFFILAFKPSLAQPPDPPTYYGDIQPILQANCYACHTQGQIGYSLYNMEDTLHVLETAQDIAFVTSTGYMPPFPPGEMSPEFVGERRLTDEEIAQIIAWAEAGAPLGNAQAAISDVPTTNAPTLRGDRIIEMAASYTPSTEVSDEYRCFLFDPQLEQDTYVTGFQIEPGAVEVVHHALLFQLDPTRIQEALAKDAADDLPGWECLGGTGVTGEILPLIQAFITPIADAAGGFSVLFRLIETEAGRTQLQAIINEMPDADTYNEQIAKLGGLEAVYQFLYNSNDRMENGEIGAFNGLIGAWTPGAQPVQFPIGTGVYLPEGSLLVMQVHYNTQAGTAPDQSKIILDIAPGAVESLKMMSMVAPVEIPCADGSDIPACTRDYAIDHAEFPLTAHYIVYGCEHTPEDFAKPDVTNVTTTCDYRVQQKGWVLQVFSHMHELGKSARIELNPDTSSSQILLDIPFWDFHWQSQYALVNPIPVEAGDTIRVTCRWDATLQKNEARYLVWGERTSDEMCLHWITLLPAIEGKTLADYGYSH